MTPTSSSPEFSTPWWQIFRNPAFIARRGLWRQMSLIAARVATDGTGDWLDVGCGSRPYEHLFAVGRWVGMDVEVSGHDPADISCDVVYDGRSFPFPAASFDGVLCTQVLEHAADADALVAEVARVLRPGGVAVVTAPMVWPEHERPYDFRRFTAIGLRSMLERAGFEDIETTPTVTGAGTVAQLSSLWTHAHIGRGVPVWSSLVTLFACAPIQLYGLFLGAIVPDDGTFYGDTAVLARRRSEST